MMEMEMEMVMCMMVDGENPQYVRRIIIIKNLCVRNHYSSSGFLNFCLICTFG